jgi:hypothetical protein
VILHTSLDIFGVEGQVPESKVKGDTVDISTISEYEWYEWVKFRDTAAKFPVSKIWALPLTLSPPWHARF